MGYVRAIMDTKQALDFLKIKKEGLAGEWEAKESDFVEDTMSRRKGILFLTKKELIFVIESGVFSKKLKEAWRVPVSKMKTAGKGPFLFRKIVAISYDVSPEGAGAIRKLMGIRQIAFKLKDADSLVNKLKKLNPGIK